jgi:hypothetical protein
VPLFWLNYRHSNCCATGVVVIESGYLLHARPGAACVPGAITGIPPEGMLKYFVLLIAILLDPAAVLLLLAAASLGRRSNG